MFEPDANDVYEVARTQLKRGEASRRGGELDEAIDQFTQVIQTVSHASDTSRSHPILVEAYICRGAAWGNCGETDKAVADFSLAIAINPDRGLAYYNRGLAWHHKDELQRAITDYTRAIEIDGQFADAYLQRDWAWRTLGQPQKAATDFSRVKELKNEQRIARKK